MTILNMMKNTGLNIVAAVLSLPCFVLTLLLAVPCLLLRLLLRLSQQLLKAAHTALTALLERVELPIKE